VKRFCRTRLRRVPCCSERHTGGSRPAFVRTDWEVRLSGTRNPAAAAPKRVRRPSGRGSKPARKTGHDAAAFEVVESKLAIPSLRAGLVRRTGLVNRLRASPDARVFTIAAPAGYGKTTLLAQWAHADSRPFAWVSLDARDDDPVALMTYLAAALNTVHPIDPAVFRAAAAGSDSIWSTSLPRLGAALASMPEPIVLVLDDVHELKHRDCVDALEPLAKHLMGGSQLVLSGHADPGVPLARMRADRRLVEVGQAELALNDAEARSLLASVGLKVTEADARELNDRTEGWAAGLHLAALFMQETKEPEPIASFSGGDRFVVDYLRTEHLSRLKTIDVEFLTRTSILDRMSGPLCDAVLGRGNSARRLQELEEANFFVVSLDHHRESYRYHHLFRDMLRSELDRLEPELVATLNRRAASWCEDNGHPEVAIEYAAAAGDFDELARLVSTHSLPFFRTGRVVTVERWFRWFDAPGLLERYPAVAALGAWVHALRGRPDEAERFAFAVEQSDYDGPMPDGSSSVRSWVSVLRAFLCPRGIAEMRADAERALEELAPGSFWMPSAQLFVGVGLLLEGQLERAEEILAQTAAGAVGSGAIYVGVVAHSELALLALGRGDLDKAETELARANDFLEDQPIEEYLPAAIQQAAGARLALESGRSATARQMLLRAMRMRGHLSRAVPWFGVQTMVELARSHLSLADVEGCRTLVREAEDIIRRRPDLGSLREQIRELRAELANAVGIDHGWASTLTAAELRLLPFLTTHLSFREIAERLFVSRNTVKSQAISVYRKLDASSRSEAIERAVQLGLVDTVVSPAARGFTPSG
jgi:LuxR family transcriptional regulator, maltose regulon positive regulatory protein